MPVSVADSWLTWGANRDYVSGEGDGLEGSALVSDNNGSQLIKKTILKSDIGMKWIHI